MALLADDVVSQLQKEFEALEKPVRLAVGFQTLQDPGSEDVRRLLEELAALSPKLSVEPVNFVLDTDRVAALGFSRTPGIAVLGGEADAEDHGIRFYGMPAGYEFGSLIDAMLLVSKGKSGLGQETQAALAAFQRPVHLQVFSTPT